jgi:hypothetical protein
MQREYEPCPPATLPFCGGLQDGKGGVHVLIPRSPTGIGGLSRHAPASGGTSHGTVPGNLSQESGAWRYVHLSDRIRTHSLIREDERSSPIASSNMHIQMSERCPTVPAMLVEGELNAFCDTRGCRSRCCDRHREHDRAPPRALGSLTGTIPMRC